MLMDIVIAIVHVPVDKRSSSQPDMLKRCLFTFRKNGLHLATSRGQCDDAFLKMRADHLETFVEVGSR